MSFSSTDTEVVYTGNGVDHTFEITYPFQSPSYIKVQLYDLADPDNEQIIDLDVGVDYQIVGTEIQLTFPDMDVFGNPILSPLPLAATDKIRIYRDTIDSRPTDYNTYQFPYPTVNLEMDRVHQRLQELRREVDRAIKLNALSLDDGETLTGEEILESIATLEQLIEDLGTGAGLPAGAMAGGFIESVDGTLAEWKEGAISGYSARFGEFFDSTGLEDTLLKIVKLTYTAPAISLSTSPGTGVREHGVQVTSVTLNATTQKRSNDITQVRFYKDGVQINLDPAPNPAGGLSTVIDAFGFAGPTSYYASVTDGTSTTNSNTVTYSYVYPYYYGKGAAGLDETGILASLTKAVIPSTASVAVTTSPTGEAFYFAYPSSYPALTSILDPNGFETISGYTVRLVDITGLDETPQEYRVYESGLTTQVNFTNTYKR